MSRSDLSFIAALLVFVFCTGCGGGKPKEDIAAQIATAEAAVRTSPTAEAYVDLSLRYFQAQNYPACVTAANEAIRRKPENSVAYNNLAACYGALSKWDEEIAAAKQALRLSPDFQLAKNNLAWAESQKRDTK
jgi:tetratricopeptide (TPR) repeat protein